MGHIQEIALFIKKDVGTGRFVTIMPAVITVDLDNVMKLWHHLRTMQS